MLQFHFLLNPVEEIPAWQTSQGQQTLSWFGLTDGWFWIAVGDQELFRYMQEARDYWQRLDPEGRPRPLPYEDYPVVRYWEDLLEMLPAVLDPIPDDLAARVVDPREWQAWQDRALHWQEVEEDETAWDTYYAAVGWWGRRTWDAGHLAHPPRLWLWRVGEVIHIRWDNHEVTLDGIAVWEAQQGEATLSVSEFLTAVESFHARFLEEMEQRVNAVGTAWTRPEVEIDFAILVREQEERSGWLKPAVDPWGAEVRRAFSWEEVRAAIERIEQAWAQEVVLPHSEAPK